MDTGDNIEKLVDGFGRVHNNLRVSVTDRCNIRCFYCMPEHNVQFQPKANILSFEEMCRVITIFSKLGIDKIRLTGGEPLVRSELPELIRRISGIDGIKEIAMTTNGVLLARWAEQLHAAGLQRLNISLDTLSESVFERISRRKGLKQVFEGIEAAQRSGFEKIKLNSIAISDLTETEIVPLARYARQRNLELRFIEFMPLDAEGNWDFSNVLDGEKIKTVIESEFGPLTDILQEDPSQPATDFAYSDMNLKVGFINPVTKPFCSSCNRLRLTADGQIRNCLFSSVEWNVKQLMRDGASDNEIKDLILECVSNKKASHGIEQDDFVRPERAMYQIGG